MDPKKNFQSFALFSLALLWLSTCFADPAMAAEQRLWAGTAKVRITPRTPVPMSGYGSRKEPFRGIHDDIFARVVALSDGVNKAVLISAEVIGFSHSFWEECTGLISKETGIGREYILLTAVHNHGGPTLGVYKDGVNADVLAYIQELKGKLAEATRTALGKLSPATIGIGKGECRMNINRVAPDGKGGTTLGRNPYGPCDHEVGVLRIHDTAGKPIAVLVNWPCHGVVLGPRNYLITGDWPGVASNHLEEGLGEGAIALMLIGASGDINPIYGPHIDFEVNNSYAFGKDAIGEDLAKVALRATDPMETMANVRISAQQRVISLPSKIVDTTGTPAAVSPGEDMLPVRLSVMKIGTLVLTGVSGEVFNQISVKMRARSPYANTWMITHCNGSSGYLITDDAYAKGGYEVRVTRVKSGAEKAISENLLAMINEL